MRIYTRTGDKGETGLGSGKRLSKDSLRVCAYGETDELNAILGVCGSLIKNSAARTAKIQSLPGAIGAEKKLAFLQKIIEQLQKDLWMLGADLASPGTAKVGGKMVPRLNKANAARLEKWIDEMDAQLPELRNFIMPGGSLLSAQLHVARAVCRRAERSIVRLAGWVSAEWTDTIGRTAGVSVVQSAVHEEVAPDILAYINRLSDLLFMMARFANFLEGTNEQTLKSGI